MGNRVIMILKDSTETLPFAMYMHWNGSQALEILENAVPRMRRNQADYSIARLIGTAHNQIDGNLSLGVISIDLKAKYNDITHGDAGIVVFDCGSGMVKCHAGYLAEKHPKAFKIASFDDMPY